MAEKESCIKMADKTLKSIQKQKKQFEEMGEEKNFKMTERDIIDKK